MGAKKKRLKAVHPWKASKFDEYIERHKKRISKTGIPEEVKEYSDIRNEEYEAVSNQLGEKYAASILLPAIVI